MRKVVLGVLLSMVAWDVDAEEVVAAETIPATETTEVAQVVANVSVFDTLYFGLGIGGNFLSEGNLSNRMIGSGVIGGGKVFNHFYLGGEFVLDFSKDRKNEWVEDTTNVKRKKGIKGVSPQLAIRAGYVVADGLIAYTKLGCSWVKSTMDFGTDSSSRSKASFVLGLGVEKAFCNKFSAALETEYNFGYKWSRAFVDADTNVTDTREFSDVARGWSVRALVKYNVKY